MTDKITIALTTPVQVHGSMTSELVLRRPTGRELREFPLKQTLALGDLYGVAAACADIPPSSMDQMDAADVMQVMEAVSGFLGVGIGGTPSS